MSENPKKYSKLQQARISEAKIMGSLLAGLLIGAFYITFIGNIPIMPDFSYYLIEFDDFFPFIILGYLLFPIPFFPILTFIIYTLYEQMLSGDINIKW